MNTMTGCDSGHIREAVEDIKKKKPEFNLMLDLYEKIFIAQENARRIIKLPDFIIPEETLSVKLKEKFPLVDISQFPIDHKVSGELFDEICDILTAEENELSDAVKKITALSSVNKIDKVSLFSSFLKEDESAYNEIEDKFRIDKQILGFVIYNALRPSISLFSEKISVYLKDLNEWGKGYCPVCGSAPEISVFEDNGKRLLACGFCGHKWDSKRIYCPFCENADHETLKYYDIEGEEEYRVDLCEKCKKFIRTIDIKKTTRKIYLPLESKSTPYLDLKFGKMGYRPGNIRD